MMLDDLRQRIERVLLDTGFFSEGIAELVADQILAVLQSYRPLYAEKKCSYCGYWRGQHIPVQIRTAEDYSNDHNMVCPNSSIVTFGEDKSDADVG